MKCLECGFNNPSDAKICRNRACNSPLERKVASLIHRHNTFQEQLEEGVRTSEYEAKRYGLEPKRLDETPQHFIDRINNQKTPGVLAEHARIMAAQEERQRAKLPARIPGSDDDRGEAV